MIGILNAKDGIRQNDRATLANENIKLKNGIHQIKSSDAGIITEESHSNKIPRTKAQNLEFQQKPDQPAKMSSKKVSSMKKTEESKSDTFENSKLESGKGDRLSTEASLESKSCSSQAPNLFSGSRQNSKFVKGRPPSYDDVIKSGAYVSRFQIRKKNFIRIFRDSNIFLQTPNLFDTSTWLIRNPRVFY